ncbi:protein lsr2 precursor [Rhodococcoides trifolii]|uniref:Protein lsr2 n=1 Tax=Rhodococcoides trifolii TaxID=908250 RepID=A0A917D250_9NOCA|nr:Lsr2 family protein [Rhodococcus trifolii]GGG07237.1 protein lsr2 precursor [Rhodococcus trifolii]
MARRTTVQMIDDVDGSLIKEGQGETVEFSLGGVSYTIDLNHKHANELYDQFAFWVEHAEKTGGRKARRSTTAAAPKKGRQDLQDVRAWAKDNGFAVSARGRISQEIQDAYDAAH